MTFDALAATYDETFGASPAARLFRFRLAERVMGEVPPPAHLLDIGCGTGDDALWLAAQGYRVDAIDASPAMIAIANRKAAGVRSEVRFECATLQRAAETKTRYDIVTSDFGALNCAPLNEWVGAVTGLLKPGGRAFVALMGRRPLPETLRRGFATADRGAAAEVRVGESRVHVEYPSRCDVERAAAGKAVVARAEAMGCFVPGPGYAGFPRRNPIAFGVLAGVEVLTRRLFFFRDRGDHTLLELRAS